MANYLPVILSPAIQDWLTGLPENSIYSWGDLCAKFINNFQGTFMKPGVEWDLYRIHQKKGEFLREFIRLFIKKKNSIPSVSDAVIMAAFRKGGSRILTSSRRCQESSQGRILNKEALAYPRANC